ncbi:MAG: hypothetical protein Ct9H300mP8_07870 [Gammaproteobacteria bacterium]|nr:MAG: hypothetical protein Ct9H300mP8_07870 [Gammaproteobacteria bacterium]
MALRSINLSLPMQLLRAREAAMSRFRPMLRGHGLTEQQWRVVRVLASEKELDIGDLSQKTFLLAPSLTRILKALVRDGLVTRTPGPTICGGEYSFEQTRTNYLQKRQSRLGTLVPGDRRTIWPSEANDLYGLLKDLQGAIDQIETKAC